MDTKPIAEKGKGSENIWLIFSPAGAAPERYR
jgi:hypothetical protein